MANEIDFASIIELCRAKFRSCVSNDRLISALHVGQALSAEDVLQIQSLAPEKRIDVSLDIVKSKGYDAFKRLCVSLETTYPYMLNCMFLGVEPPCSSPALKKASINQNVISNHSDNGSKEGPLLKDDDQLEHAPLSPLSNHSNDQSLSKSSEDDYKRIQSRCLGAMHEVDILRRQHAEMVNRCELAVQEADYYRRQHQVIHAKCDSLVREAQLLKGQYDDIIVAKEKLQQDYEEIVLLREQEKKSSRNLMNASDHESQINEDNKSWNRDYNDVDKLQRENQEILDDYDALKEDYALIANKLKEAGEENLRLKQQLDNILPERDALHSERNALKQQCTAAIRGYDKALRERDESLHNAVQAEQQRDLALKECDQVFTLRVKFNKDISKLQEERNAALSEYKLVMSERDSVHREIERLQDGINDLSKQNSTLKDEREKMKQETECLRQEIVLVLADRDKARKESFDRRERLHEAVKDRETAVKRLEELQQDVEMLKQERNAARKERSEAIVHRDKILKECFQVEKMFDLYDGSHDSSNAFKLQFENLSQELTKAWNEAEVAMMRRDWAFNERDKIVRQLQVLRDDYEQCIKDRNDMIAELNSIHNEGELLSKKYHKCQRELHYLRKHCDSHLTQEERLQMLSSVDSAIDTDSQDYDMETITLEKTASGQDLGFTIGGGSDLPLYPTDSSIFVVDVVPGSLADGKLRVNDCLLRANSVDLTNVDFNTANKALRRGQDMLTVTFMRRRPSRGKTFIQHVNLKMTLGRDLGLSVDSGLHIRKIEPGSVAADVELLSIGDKILMINQVPVDHLPYEDAKRLLKTSTLSLTIFKDNASRRSSRRSLTDLLAYHEKTGTSTTADHQTASLDEDRPIASHFRSPSAPVPSMAYRVKANSLLGPVHVRCSSAVNTPASYSDRDSHLSSPRSDRILSDEEREKILKELLTKDQQTKQFELPIGNTASSLLVSAETRTDEVRSSSATPPPPMRSNSYMSAVLTRRPSTDRPDLHLNIETNSSFIEKSQMKSDQALFVPRSNSVGSAAGMTGRTMLLSDSSGKITPSSPHNINRSDPLALSQKTTAMYADHRYYAGHSSTANYVQTWGVGKRTRHPPVYAVMNRPQSASSSRTGNQSISTSGNISPDYSRFDQAFEPSPIPNNAYKSEKQYYGTFPGKGRRINPVQTVELMQHFENGGLPQAVAKPTPSASNRSVSGRTSSSHGSLNSSVSSDRATPVSKLIYPSIQPVYEEENGDIIEDELNRHGSHEMEGSTPLFETHFEPINDESDSQPRQVIIEKNAYPLGISIAQSQNGGIFVSAVTEQSNAERSGLQYGDQILEYNGINLRCANYAQAALILKQSSDANTAVTMLVQHFIPKTSQPLESRSSNDPSLVGNHRPSRMDSLQSDGSDLTKITNDISLTPGSPIHFELSDADINEEPLSDSLESGNKGITSREISYHNEAPFNLGIEIIGGNAVGVFVSKIQQDGIIAARTEVQCGDRILKINDVDFSQMTAEQATLELGKSYSNVALSVEYDPIGYQKAQEGNCDSFYVRALFDHLPQGKDDLSFKRGDVLHVTDTMHLGQLGIWKATLVSDNAEQEKRERGSIPSRRKAEQEILLRRCSIYSEEKVKSRYGLFRRSKKGSHNYTINHSRESSDSRGEDSAPSSPGSPMAFNHVAYESVQRLESPFLRPVVVLGPLAQPICDKLVMEKPYKFARCLPEIVKTSHEVIEQRMNDGVYIDYNLSRKRTSYACITIDSIENVMQKSKHCLLDVNYSALERLLPLHLHPIIVWVHFKSPKIIRDFKDGHYIPEKINHKDAKNMFDSFAAIETEIKPYISFFVTGNNLTTICSQISSQVDDFQKKDFWVSTTSTYS